MRRAVAAALLLCACGREQARREEAARVVEVVEGLIMADRRAKTALIERLRSTPCTLPDVCDARQACVEAFAPIAEAAKLQLEARALLDRNDPSLAPQVDAKLDEAEKLNLRARKLQDPCLAATTALRQTHKL